jgi:hypothetical protein
VTDDGNYRVYWPRATRQGARKAGARRLEGLGGKTIAFLWDQLFQGDLMFEVIKEELLARDSNMSFIDWTVFGNTHGADERALVTALPHRLREFRADAVISAVGA